MASAKRSRTKQRRLPSSATLGEDSLSAVSRAESPRPAGSVELSSGKLGANREVQALKSKLQSMAQRRLVELTDNFRLAETFAQPADLKQSLAALRTDLAEVPVVGHDRSVTDVYLKIENEKCLSRIDKDLIWGCLAIVRESFYQADAASSGYQWNMNWKHTRAEIDQVLEAAKLLRLDGVETRDAMLASIFSDSVKNRKNFITHNIDGAVGACQVLSYFMDPSDSRDLRSMERIGQAVREHQIAPPEFMARATVILISKKLQLKTVAQKDAKREAKEHEQVLNSIYKKMSDPMNAAHLTEDRQRIAFSPQERKLLEEVNIKEWYVPHPSNPDSRLAHAVIAGDHSINYNHPEGFAKIALIRGPDTESIFEDPTIHNSLDSAVSSFADSFRVLLPEVQPMAMSGLRRTKTAVERVVAIMRELFNGITYGARCQRESGASMVASAVRRAHDKHTDLFTVADFQVSNTGKRYTDQAIDRVASVLQEWMDTHGDIPFKPKNGEGTEPGSAKLPFWNAPLKYPTRDAHGIVQIASLTELELRQYQFAERIREIAVELLRAEQWIF